jgi:hypothetical protein
MLLDGRRCDEELDQFGLLAGQDYNLGNAANWLFSFRGGLKGVRSRLLGLQNHSRALHEWSVARTLWADEHHIATMLFCMDSALEFFVFMLNALGQAYDKDGFRDVSSAPALKGISPRDVLPAPGKKPRPGYPQLFPNLFRYWNAKAEIIRLVCENHDVTKHRQRAHWGGKFRDDPPPGFFPALVKFRQDPPPGFSFTPAVPGDDLSRFMVAPMEWVRIPKDPKEPIDQLPSGPSAWTTLENLEAEYRPLICESFCIALSDARINIKLNETQLRNP